MVISGHAAFVACRLRGPLMSSERFKGVVICCTGIGTKERAVAKGGGSYRRDFNEEVTHLIAISNSLTDKYKAAVSRKIPVVHPKWLIGAYQSRVTGSNPNLDEFLVKPFDSFCISISGHSVEEREWVAQTVQANGGTFSPDLSKSCTHLVADLVELQREERPSPKITYAQKWNIPIVSIRWIVDCARKRGRLDETNYMNAKEENAEIFKGIAFFVHADGKQAANDLCDVLQSHSGQVVNDVHNCDYIISTSMQPGGKSFDALKPVVHLDWINECVLKGAITPHEPYQIAVAGASEKSVTPRRHSINKNHELTCNSLDEDSFLRHEMKVSLPSLDKKLFDGITFFVLQQSFQSELLYNELHKLLAANGGTISKALSNATYLVATFNFPAVYQTSSSQRDKAKIVTDIWILSCIQENSIIPLTRHVLFIPSMKEVAPPVANSTHIISITGFEELHRDLTIKLVEYCGFKYSDKFSRKASYLVCRKMSGAKYEKALEWNVPIKIESWLTDQLVACTSNPNASRDVENETQTRINQSFMLDTKTIIDSGISPLIPRRETKPLYVSNKDVTDFSKHLATIAQSAVSNKNASVPPTTPLMPVVAEKDIMAAESNADVLLHNGPERDATLNSSIVKQSETSLKQVVADAKHIFHGLFFALSPRLWHRRIELGNIVEACGGTFKCNLEPGCTHFIHYGNKLTENFKEFRQAKSQKCHIVSPWWLIRSREAGHKLPEADFPHIYVPGKSLNLQSVPLSKPVSSVQLNFVDSGRHDNEFTVDDSMLDEINSLIEKNSKRQKYSSDLLSFSNINSTFDVNAINQMTQGREVSNDSSNKPEIDRENIMSNVNRPVVEPNVVVDLNESHDASSCGTVKFTDVEYERAKSNLFKKCNVDIAASPIVSLLTSPPSTGSSKVEPIVQEESPSSSFVFLLSALTEPQRASFAKYIAKYGATVLKTSSWDSTCTHLICGTLARNEKVLSACASGCWILKPSFVLASKEAGRFVDEYNHEWAQTDQNELAIAARYWRIERENCIRKDGQFGPFSGYSCLLFVNNTREIPFKHVIEAGNGTLLDLPSNLNDRTIADYLQRLKYIFVENESFVTKIPKSLMAELDKYNVHVLRIDYISDYLIKKGTIELSDYRVNGPLR